jgi:hypothetical protein
MATLNTTLTDDDGNPPVIGDDFDVTRTVTDVPASTTISKAWLYVKLRKTDADADALITKEITSGAVTGVGQITDTGADETGAVLFQLTADDTALLTGNQLYHYGIKVKTASGKYKTVEQGCFVPQPAVVQAT